MAISALAKKLRMQNAQRALIVNAPDGYLGTLGEVPSVPRFNRSRRASSILLTFSPKIETSWIDSLTGYSKPSSTMPSCGFHIPRVAPAWKRT